MYIIICVRKLLLSQNYVTSEGAVSHNVFNFQQLSIVHFQQLSIVCCKVSFHANNNFE